VPHDPDRPCLCPDGVFWSVPTRPYKLASHFDLTGTSNQPVTVQLPDLNELAAQAGQPKMGGVGFAKPKGSLLISGDADGKPIKPGLSSSFEICFFPIPLITIVATFVFNIFLPVIMLIFQLWWMLALKLCIPPSLDVAAGINAEIGLDGKIGIDADVDFNATVEAKLQAGIDVTINGPDINAEGVDVSLKATVGPAAAAALSATYSPIALANMELSAAALGDPAGPDAPSVVANLDFEAEVIHA
jgi:hypothetical protein